MDEEETGIRTEGETEDSGIYLQTFRAIIRSTNVDDAIAIVRNNYGFTHVTYHLAHTVGMPIDAPFVRSTYPREWIGHYIVNNLAALDPVVRFGFTRPDPFDWSDLPVDAGALRVMEEARAFGVGPSGFSTPLVDKKGRKALLSVNSVLEGDEWRAFITPKTGDLGNLAYDLHQKAITEAYRGADTTPALAPRELECLHWTAKGKTYAEIATILDLSDHTVRTYLKTARFKLDCVTLAQAVAKAGELHII